jgi:hypothetical protein
LVGTDSALSIIEEELMNDNTFASITRHAAVTVSRRMSLLALGGAGLTAVAAPTMAAPTMAAPTMAAGGKAGKKAMKLCRRQREQCRAFFVERCQGSQNCLEALLPCCELFAKCSVAAGIECVSPIR